MDPTDQGPTDPDPEQWLTDTPGDCYGLEDEGTMDASGYPLLRNGGTLRTEGSVFVLSVYPPSSPINKQADENGGGWGGGGNNGE